VLQRNLLHPVFNLEPRLCHATALSQLTSTVKLRERPHSQRPSPCEDIPSCAHTVTADLHTDTPLLYTNSGHFPADYFLYTVMAWLR